MAISAETSPPGNSHSILVEGRCFVGLMTLASYWRCFGRDSQRSQALFTSFCASTSLMDTHSVLVPGCVRHFHKQ